MNRTITLRGALLLLVAFFGILGARPAAAQVVGGEGWSRATVPGATTGVAYFVLTNQGSESANLIKIVSPVSDKVLIHRSSIDSQGVARMWPVAKLEIEPGETVRFEPNGLHVMFMDLKKPFVTGQKVPLQLTFEGEPEITVLLDVRSLTDAAPADMHHDRMQMPMPVAPADHGERHDPH